MLIGQDLIIGHMIKSWRISIFYAFGHGGWVKDRLVFQISPLSKSRTSFETIEKEIYILIEI